VRAPSEESIEASEEPLKVPLAILQLLQWPTSLLKLSIVDCEAYFELAGLLMAKVGRDLLPRRSNELTFTFLDVS
jgi:hypothetical protein